MKISLNWLNYYITTGLSAKETADILSDLGFPCEGIESFKDDTVLDIEVTSNRGDCLSYIGLARELAAFTGCELKFPAIELEESEKSVADFVSVEIDEANLCWRYTARIIEAVKIGSSPDWMAKRLEAVGLRSVNNVVDATNYAMMELGQPPHAFDYQKIADGRIIVRKATTGEHIVSIDGSECRLEPEMLIIADSKGPVALAGVMGGLETEVSNSTTTILLEDAYFDPVSVRTTSRRLSLLSEASFRFERIVDAEMIDLASQRTAQLIVQAAGGKVATGVIDIYPKKPTKDRVMLRLTRLKKLLGIEIPQQRTVEILEKLGFQPQQQDDSIVCSVPTWRSDIYREADLIEEVARVYGYSKVPTEKKMKIEVTPVDDHQKTLDSMTMYLNGCGFYETINVTFLDKSSADIFVSDKSEKYLTVRDESRRSSNLLRRSLLPSLFNVMRTNVNAKNSPCRIFEIADTFAPSDKKDSSLPDERNKLALACDSDFREIRGVIEVLVESLNRSTKISFEPFDLPWAKNASQVLADKMVIGYAGIASQKTKEKFDIKDVEICAAELDFDLLSKLQIGVVKIKPIPRFPAIDRDLSLVVDESVTWADITRAVDKKASEMLEDIRFIDIYRGKAVPDGKKSVTLSLRFRDEDGTLTHQIVDDLQASILKSLTKSVGAELRTT